MKYQIKENNQIKALASEHYNYVFNKDTGFFARWGKTKEDDPQFSPFGPEILDIEILSCCRGIRDRNDTRKPCKFCYKSNTSVGNIMSLETFKTIIDKMPKTLVQLALGCDAEGTMNPHMFSMMKYAREKGIIPNLTIADISSEVAQLIASLAGACAVSYYPQMDKNRCYDSVDLLSNRYGMNQVNIHAMISKETFEDTKQLFEDVKKDKRLKKLNAVVMLSLKQKGRGVNFNPLSVEQFKELVDMAMELKIPYGFDSCSAGKFLKSIKDHERFEQFKMMVEPCESSLFSSYINEKGEFYPCSFTEKGIYGGEDWNKGLDVVNCIDFVKDIWNHPKTVSTREKILKCRNRANCCFAFEV